MSNPLLDSDKVIQDPNRSVASRFREFMVDRFDLRGDQAYEGQTLESVRKDVQFRGANLWILMFAILICSIGLNVNSTAVIIGAMLISPLMGPILGIGVGVAIYDFDLLLTALKNLGIATLVSVIVSATYFFLSPLTEAQSELLARVSPNLWDVLIATFGGFAGIIAVSRREKGNALPGVAIATALMPPVCTAGYSVATGQWWYFIGSLYLFFINLVFIAFATFVLARFMRFARHSFVDVAKERRTRRWTYGIVMLVAIPSVYTAYTTVEKTVFRQRANTFIDDECRYANAEIIAREVNTASGDHARTIQLVLVGQNVPKERIDSSRANMERYGLGDAELIVMQDSDEQEPLNDSERYTLLGRQSSLASLYKRDLEANRAQDKRIQVIEQSMTRGGGTSASANNADVITSELSALYPGAAGLRFAMLPPSSPSDSAQTRIGVAYLPANAQLSSLEQMQLRRYLAVRAEADSIVLMR